jgi:photosystem II stability/assembly factor-like uncharacterized protein
MVRRRLNLAFVGLLVVGNALLLYLVTQKMADSTGAERAGRQPSPTHVGTAEPRPEPGGRQFLVVADDDTIFRVFSGSCDGTDGPSINFSSNAGASFGEVGLPENIRSVFALSARSADDLELIAAGEDCEPARFVSSVGGDGWDGVEDADAWYLHPHTKEVHSPAGTANTECNENLTLSTVGGSVARVFCVSGVLVGSTDAGRTWERLGILDGVRAAAFTSRRQAFALAPDRGCVSGTFTSDDSGRSWTPAGCLDASPARALAANRNILVAIAGNSLYVSEDQGRTWKEAG